MSVLEDLRVYEKRVTERLAELQPLVAEYQELERVAERLGLDRTPARASRQRRAATPARARSKAAATRGKRRARRTPGRKPERRDQVLELVRQRPGITVPDIAKELGVDPTGLYRVVRQLAAAGTIKKTGKELVPAA